MNSKKIRKMLVLGAAVMAFGASSLTVSAAGLKDVFDADYYAERYPDLKTAFGDDENALYQHFLTYGLKEGRNMSPILDVAAYRAAYPDLDAAFGDNWNAYVEHFLTYGAKENRTEGVLFNPVQYAEAYADIKAAYGDNMLAIVEHFLTYGIDEGRTEGTSKGYDSISALEVAEAEAEAAAAAEDDDDDEDETSEDSPQYTEKRVDNSDGSYSILTYDENGNNVKIISYRSSGVLQNIAFGEYYSDGLLKKDITYFYDNSGELSMIQGFTYYDRESKRVESIFWGSDVEPYPECDKFEWTDNGYKVSHYRDGTYEGCSTKTYAANGSDYTCLSYDADGNFTSGYIYNATTQEETSCDEDGNPITDSTETDSSESEDTTSVDTTTWSSASE